MEKKVKKIKDRTVEEISEFLKKIFISELSKEKIEEILEKVKNEKIDGPSLLTIFYTCQLSKKFDISIEDASFLHNQIAFSGDDILRDEMFLNDGEI